jgi:hypothetical protein
MLGIWVLSGRGLGFRDWCCSFWRLGAHFVWSGAGVRGGSWDGIDWFFCPFGAGLRFEDGFHGLRFARALPERRFTRSSMPAPLWGGEGLGRGHGDGLGWGEVLPVTDVRGSGACLARARCGVRGNAGGVVRGVRGLRGGVLGVG